MASVDRRPPTGAGYATERVAVHREARRIAKQAARIGEAAEEHELEELDDAIEGTDREELARLRSEARSTGGDTARRGKKA